MNYQKHPKWYHALHALHFGFGSGLVYLVIAGAMVSYVVSPSWLRQVHANGYGVFSETSFWNTPIPRYPEPNDSSAALVQSIVDQVQASGSQFDTSDHAAPVYVVDGSLPTEAVTPYSCDGGAVNGALTSQWQAVPIPFYAAPSDSADHRMIIYQPSSQSVWEFDAMQKVGSSWQACHGGRIDATGNGVFPSSLGVMGSSLAQIGGQVSLADLKRGVIGHAIGLTLPNTSGVSWPAVRSDGSGGLIPQGMRFQLDPNLNVDALGLSPTARMIAKTAQTYGLVVWGTSASVSIMGENPKSSTVRGLPNPYTSVGGTSLAGFPWSKLHALLENYGQNGETPSISEFTSSTSNASGGQQIGFSWQAVNIDECAIPGVASHLGSSGSVVGYDLHSATDFTLSCSGPGGSVSRNLSVAVHDLPDNAPPPIISTTTIDLPVSGLASILPQFNYSWAVEAVQKVVYYERGNLLQSTTTPPFAFDTTQIIDGPHKLVVRIYYRDGHREDRNITLRVQNHSTSPVVVGPLSATTPPPVLGRLAIAGLMASMFLVMIAGFWYGWRRLYPHHKSPKSWLVSYV